MQPVKNDPVLLEVALKEHDLIINLQNVALIAVVSKMNRMVFCDSSHCHKFYFPDGKFPAETISNFLESLQKRSWWVHTKQVGYTIAINLGAITTNIKIYKNPENYRIQLYNQNYKCKISHNFIDKDSKNLLKNAWAGYLAFCSNLEAGQDLVAELNLENAKLSSVETPSKSSLDLDYIMSLENQPLPPPPLNPPVQRTPSPEVPGAVQVVAQQSIAPGPAPQDATHAALLSPKMASQRSKQFKQSPINQRNEGIDALEKLLEDEGNALLEDIHNREKRECLQKALYDAKAQKSYHSGSQDKKFFFIGLIAFAETILKIDPNSKEDSTCSNAQSKLICSEVELEFDKIQQLVMTISNSKLHLTPLNKLVIRLKQINMKQLVTKVACNRQDLWYSQARVAQMLAVCNQAVQETQPNAGVAAPAAAAGSNKRKGDQEKREDDPKMVREEATLTEEKSG